MNKQMIRVAMIITAREEAYYISDFSISVKRIVGRTASSINYRRIR